MYIQKTWKLNKLYKLHIWTENKWIFSSLASSCCISEFYFHFRLGEGSVNGFCLLNRLSHQRLSYSFGMGRSRRSKWNCVLSSATSRAVTNTRQRWRQWFPDFKTFLSQLFCVFVWTKSSFSSYATRIRSSTLLVCQLSDVLLKSNNNVAKLILFWQQLCRWWYVHEEEEKC